MSGKKGERRRRNSKRHTVLFCVVVRSVSAAMSSLAPHQQSLLKQVLSMSSAEVRLSFLRRLDFAVQIDALPAETRAQITRLRVQIAPRGPTVGAPADGAAAAVPSAETSKPPSAAVP